MDGACAITELFVSSNDTLYVPTPLSVNMLAVTDIITKLLVAVNTGYVIGNVKTKLLVLYVLGSQVLSKIEDSVADVAFWFTWNVMSDPDTAVTVPFKKSVGE